ncbi:MAG TPA: ABC transporter permease [Anaerolineae bacterium]|nr:ABC transporter permease [Anaerolineae bacterium]HQK12814.1 ABC transporter permease [Anaerolineae bacterium]
MEEPQQITTTNVTESEAKGKQEQLSQAYWSLVWWKFKKNKLAIVGAIIIILFYTSCGLFAEFVAPYRLDYQSSHLEARPQPIVFKNPEGKFSLRPAVYGLDQQLDLVARTRTWVVNKEKIYPLSFFVKGQPYKLLGLIPTNIHLFGVDTEKYPDGTAFLFGTDRLGRDLFSRIFYGGRLSLFLGLLGQFLTLVLGMVLGAVSGYYGGTTDILIQRLVEFMGAFPDIPLFMALAAAIPVEWSPILVYFMLTIILVFIRWGGLARQVRGLILSLREREYVLAAKSAGASDWRIMSRHLLPGTLSHVIVIATLMIPGMILSETALSWLGLGLRPPLTSWGVLLQEVSAVRVIRFAPWMLTPVPFIILAVLGFNMLGDGLRDALDPYSGR